MEAAKVVWMATAKTNPTSLAKVHFNVYLPSIKADSLARS